MDSQDRPGATPDQTADASDDPTTDENNTETPLDRSPVSRRGTLAALLGVGGLGLLASDSASAQPVRPWEQDVDANGYALFDLGSLAMTANPTAITDFEGTNLSVDENGVLNAAGGGQSDVYDDGTEVVADSDVLDFGANLSVIGSGTTATVDADEWNSSVDANGADISNVGTAEMDDLRVSNVGASIYHSGPQSIPPNSQELIEFDTKRFDHQNEFDTSTNKFVAADDGFYHVDARITLLTSRDGSQLEMRVRVNDEEVAFDSQHVSSNSGRITASVSKLVQLAQSDSVSVYARQNSGSARDLVSLQSNTHLTIHQVG